MSDAVGAQIQSRTSREKSPDAFRTISEVADALNVPQHVLRFWESKFTQVKPLKRGGGRRYYRPDDVHLLRGIRNLLYHEGYTIRGVQKVLREAGVKMVVEAGRQGDGEGAGTPHDVRTAQIVADESDLEAGTGTSLGGGAAGGLDPETRTKLRAILSRLRELGDTLKNAG